MNSMIDQIEWSENVILVDADYVDSVVFNLICNFERMLGRRIPQADLARWIDCVALDGGIRPMGEGQEASIQQPTTQVVLLHAQQRQKMDNFVPTDYAAELNGKAFSDHLGEFVISSCPTTDLVGKDRLFADVLQTVCTPKEVKRIMVIPNAEDSMQMATVNQVLRQADAAGTDKRITLFAMQPLPGGPYRQEILGYSLMAALGITSQEIEAAQ